MKTQVIWRTVWYGRNISQQEHPQLEYIAESNFLKSIMILLPIFTKKTKNESKKENLTRC